MSQLFKSILAKHFLAQRAFAYKTSSQLRSTHFNGSLLVSLPTSRALQINTYVTNSNPPKFNKFQSKLAYDSDRKFREDIVKYEQYGIEDAEPVEFDNKAVDYSSQSNANGFDKYNLPAELMRQMNKFGYNTPFEIQEATLTETLAGRDMVAKAFTGSGKTLAFAIPIITKILNNPNKNNKNPKCLILSPTRELCLQLQKCIHQLAPNLNTVSVYGGSGYENQIKQFRTRVDIVCATPGRLRDFMQRKIINIDSIDTVCLDEADELLTPNFEEQIKDVLELGNKKQMLMFSATINKNVFELIKTYMHDPAFIDLTKGQKYKLPANIEHCIVNSYRKDINHIITHYLKEYKAEKCIIFTKTKKEATELNYTLRKLGNLKSHDMHSDHSQFKREQILRAFRTEGLNVLIATDVAARGLDIQEVNLVIQVGFPANGIEYYIHRSGRCGRAGRLGTSILLDDGRTKIDRDLFRLVQFKKLALPDSIPENVLDDISDDFETERKPFNNSYRKPRYISNQDRQKTSYNGLDDISGDSATERKPFNNSYRKPRYLSNQDSYNQDRPKTSYNRDRMNIEGQYKNYRSKSSSEFDREDKWSSY